jgi:hypothetical protein
MTRHDLSLTLRLYWLLLENLLALLQQVLELDFEGAALGHVVGVDLKGGRQLCFEVGIKRDLTHYLAVL